MAWERVLGTRTAPIVDERRLMCVVASAADQKAECADRMEALKVSASLLSVYKQVGRK